ALLRHVPVQVVDLRAAALHHVLEHGGPAARTALGVASHVGLYLRQTLAGGGIDEPLGRDAVDRLHLVAPRTPHLHHLRRPEDGNAPWYVGGPGLGRVVAGESRDGIDHAVHRELGPALAPEVGGDLGGRDVIHDARDGLGPRRVLAIVLADLESN